MTDKCPRHPKQYINNFCRRRQCMVGLCPTCICQHTQSHHKRRTLPDYQNIQQTYQLTQEMLKEYQSAFENQKNKINQISTSMEAKTKKIWDLFKKAKKQCVEAVEKYFNEYEHQLQEQIQYQENKLGLQNENSFKVVLEDLYAEEDKIQQCLLKLENKKSPSLVRQIHLDVLPSIDQIIHLLAGESKKHSQFQPALNYKKTQLPQLKSAIEEIVNLQFVYEPLIPLINYTRSMSPVQQSFGSRVVNKSVGKPIPNSVMNALNSYTKGSPLKKSRITFNNRDWSKENSLLTKSPSNSFFTTY